ncbi:Ubiquitin [Chelydra serpentina]|uniref:Ubiquitin n=1 Tax=Chelydra serpentina TaxID=8475 RepID=A0A8T1SE82_CHESE|nr:Ubiquitin [Chelydra serpentina]
MNIINTLLSLLFGILAGLILVLGLIVMFCILLFSTRLTVTFGETKMVTIFEKAAMVTEFVKPSPVTKPEATHLVIEFDKAELLAKLAKEIAPSYSVNMQISVKNKTWTDISVKVDPNDNTWNAKANIQVKSDAQEDINLEEESFIFNCKQLNDSCTVTTYNIQNEPTIQSLELSDIVRAILQVFYGTLQKPSAVGSTDTSEISKSKEAEIYQSSEE